jgi:hypothetical protein
VLAVFSLGLVAGGTLTGLVIWLLSGLADPVPAQARPWLILAVAALGVAREFGLVRLPLPQNARQIPQDVLQRNLLRGSMQFGFELGTGVRTYVSASAPYVAAIALLLSHQAAAATLLTGTAFGLGRVLSAALTLQARDPDRPALIASRIPWVAKLTVLAILGALALLLLR